MNHYKYYGHDDNNISRVFGITKKDCEEQKKLYLDKKKQKPSINLEGLTRLAF